MGRSAVKIISGLEIFDTSSDGWGICRHDDLVYFIPGTVPGDVIEAETWKVRRKFWSGRVLHYQKRSEDRVNPACAHFGSCGGCKWQNMNYAAQLRFKEKMVRDCLERIGGIESAGLDVLPIIGSKNNYAYRNRLDFSFSSRRWFTEAEMNMEQKPSGNALGFHVPRMFDRIIDIQRCHLMPPLNDEVRNGVRSLALKNGFSFYDHKAKSGLLRGMIIRTTTTGECMVMMMFGEDHPEHIQRVMEYLSTSFNFITSLLYVVNLKANDTMYDLDVVTYAGQGYITEEMEGLKFRVGPKSFYQTNPVQALELYKVARDFARIQEPDVVYDLYTGTGTIANFVARRAKKVIGVESVPEAIEAAKENSVLNGIQNTSFYAGEMRKIFTRDFVLLNGKPSVVITDPPRAGMDEETCRLLLELETPRIVYVSCNPSTQARDIRILGEKYRLLRSQPVDMFPHTAHVENVVELVTDC
ncbi:MAG: 23S rRNA (uracil(1939)-C(5))-methyltransferase RlmD [Bacteroidia bacterium]|nr:23S rRNA (uracil(1939)-C(5))-methyltransferase RlmD [Bacteroidia bacterium]